MNFLGQCVKNKMPNDSFSPPFKKEEISSNNDEDVQDPISILLSVFEDQINF